MCTIEVDVVGAEANEVADHHYRVVNIGDDGTLVLRRVYMDEAELDAALQAIPYEGSSRCPHMSSSRAVREWARLPEPMRRRFLARDELVAALSVSPPSYPPKLRMKRVRSTEEAWEMSFAGGGRNSSQPVVGDITSTPTLGSIWRTGDLVSTSTFSYAPSVDLVGDGPTGWHRARSSSRSGARSASEIRLGQDREQSCRRDGCRV